MARAVGNPVAASVAATPPTPQPVLSTRAEKTRPGRASKTISAAMPGRTYSRVFSRISAVTQIARASMKVITP